ncbi:MAG: hypothetical protein R6X25_04150 [Candidatus Krumholzibacteriia bacterium]
MPRHLVWVPLAIIVLAVVFALVCLLVRLSRGHPWFVRRKLAVGALLLSLTWSTSGCDDRPDATCYAPQPPEMQTFEFDEQFLPAGTLQLDVGAGTQLTGEVVDRDFDAFAFRLLSAGEQEVTRGALIAADGAFDENTEPFVLDLGADVAPGEYKLEIYPGSPDVIEPGAYLLRVTLMVVDGSR